MLSFTLSCDLSQQSANSTSTVIILRSILFLIL